MSRDHPKQNILLAFYSFGTLHISLIYFCLYCQGEEKINDQFLKKIDNKMWFAMTQ